MKNVSVENMRSSNGNEVPNQFLIRTEDGVYFQSYSSVIAFKPFVSADEFEKTGRVPGKITLDREKWDYSRTTGKYRNDFLRETKAETERKIKSGIYTLADLNG